MRDILKHLTDNVMTYVDDILCVDVQTEQHFKTIDNVLQAFIQRGLKIKLESANFFQNSINFLGRKINSDGSFCPIEKHLSAIKNLKSPQTHSECKSVLGLINWILNFVSLGSIRTQPINDCLRKRNFKNGNFFWTEQAENALNDIKKQLTSAPVLGLPGDGTYHIFSDASSKGMASVLLNYNENKWSIIGYSSRPTSLTESKLTSSSSLEAIGLQHCLQHFRSILFGRQFFAYTDNSSLIHIMQSHSFPPNKKVLNAISKIQEYPMQLIHVPAQQNGAADALSRLLKKTLKNILDGNPSEEKFHIKVDKILKGIKGNKSLAPSENSYFITERKKIRFLKHHVTKKSHDLCEPLKSILKIKYCKYQKSLENFEQNCRDIYDRICCPLFGKDTKKTPEKTSTPKPTKNPSLPSEKVDKPLTRWTSRNLQQTSENPKTATQKDVKKTPKQKTADRNIETPTTNPIDTRPGTSRDDHAPHDKTAEKTKQPSKPETPSLEQSNTSNNRLEVPNYEVDEHGNRRSGRARHPPDRLQVGLDEIAKKRANREARKANFQVFLPIGKPVVPQRKTIAELPQPLEQPIQPIAPPKQRIEPPIQQPNKVRTQFTENTEIPIPPTLENTADLQIPQPPANNNIDINDTLPHKYFPENYQLFEESRPNLIFKNRFHGTIPDLVRKRIRELAKRNYKLQLDRESLRGTPKYTILI